MKNGDMIESVISLLTQDGKLTLRERKFLNSVCKRLRIPKKRRDEALALAKQGKARICLPHNEADKNRLVYLMVQAIVANGEIAPEKRMVLHELVDMLGISRKHADRFLETRLQEVQEQEASSPYQTKSITCPKCGYAQTTAYKCKRCGIIFKKYEQKNAPDTRDADALMDLLASSNKIQGKTP